MSTEIQLKDLCKDINLLQTFKNINIELKHKIGIPKSPINYKLTIK